MLKKSEKNEEWWQNCMDALESVGRSQFIQNMRFVENYELVKGRFIYKHYFEEDDYSDMIGQLTKEFAIPSYLRHYDIASKVVNTLSGEWQTRPDFFRVKAHDEKTGNEYQRTQTDLLQKYVMAKINAEVSRKLLEMGVDENKQDFNSDEEMQAYQKQVEQLKQQLTPPQISEYMKTTWSSSAELWGQHQLELDRKRFKFLEKEKVEFEDMLIADRCFRHFYLTPNGYNQETWNPINVFFHKSPDVNYIEDGDYVGRVFYLTVSDIIDRYGYKMKKEDIEHLQELAKPKDKHWNYAAGTEYVYENYMMPFKGYPAYDIVRQSQGFLQPENNLPYLDSNFFTSLYGGRYFNERRGYFFVVEGYWKSQEKIGKLIFKDPETGQIRKVYVDEDFVVPANFKEIDSVFDESNEENTVTWTWVNRTWKGTKICVKNHAGFTSDIYVDVKPTDFQFKADNNLYGSKLPVCGQVFSIRNSQSQSLVDLIKPHQIGHNVAMNQAYAEMQKDYGKFLIMDVNMFPDKKDWGGAKAYERFMLIAKELGVTVVDTSPANVQGAAGIAGGHYPKEIDLDASARILSRLKIAEAFEEFALKQVGFNQYRLGQQSNSTPVGTAEAGQTRSFAQTESYFTNFSNYIQRCNKMNLDIAQYVQSKEQDVTVTYVKSDLSRAFVKILGTDLLLSDLHVYVSNSQEDIRQLESLKQLALSNNTTNATVVDLAEIITSNSPAQIKIKLKESYDKQQQRLDQQFQLEQQKIDQQKQLEELKMQQESADLDKTLENKKEVAYITTFGRQQDNLKDQNTDQTPDILEYDKLGQKQQEASDKIEAQREKTSLERDKAISEHDYRMKKLELDKKKIEAGLQVEEKKLDYAKIMKGKELEQKAKADKIKKKTK